MKPLYPKLGRLKRALIPTLITIGIASLAHAEAQNKKPNPTLEQIRKSLSIHHKSQTEADWISSGYTPTDIISNLKALSQDTLWNDFWTGLESLPVEELTLFQSDLELLLRNSKQDNPLTRAKKLISRIHTHWDRQRVALTTQKRAPQLGSKYKLALAFDGPLERSRIQQILHTLKSHKTKATFFVSQEDLVANFELALKIRNEGHLLGSSGRRWASQLHKPVAPLARSNQESHLRLLRASGQSSALFLFPFRASSEPLRADLRAHKITPCDEIPGVKLFSLSNWKNTSAEELFASINAEQTKFNEHETGLLVLRPQLESNLIALELLLNQLSQKWTAATSPFAILPDLSPELALR